MLNGEKLPKFGSPEEAADVYVEHLTREQLEKVVKNLILLHTMERPANSCCPPASGLLRPLEPLLIKIRRPRGLQWSWM